MGLFDKLKAYLAEDETEDADNETLHNEEDYQELPDDDEEEASSEGGKETQNETQNETKKGFSLKKLFGRRKTEKDEASTEGLSEEVRTMKTLKVSEAKVVQDFCEQLVEVSVKMNDISREYSLVTRYLTDIQRIEELPLEMAEEIVDIAQKIQTLDKNRQMYIASKNLLPPEQYSVMSAYEDEVVEAIKNLYDMEMRDGVLKNDMGYLEGEKEDLKYMRGEYSDGISKLRGIIIAILTLFLLTNCMLIVYTITTKKNVIVISLFTALIAMIAFTISFLHYQSIKREFKVNEAKIKRAVSLQNKVKAKYINNVNTVDYIYEKYGVSSGKELEYRWIQYNTMVEDAEKYNKTNNNLKRYCDELTLRLDRIGVEDPDVWTKQLSALVDRREMVEIKHGLNQRRKKLRDNMATCEKIKSNAIMAIKAALTENPVMEEVVKKQLSPYGLKVE